MDAIILQGVKTHNLKNLNLQLPHNRLYVVTGVSGSGKSSLAFDTLYAEGQRRYVESLSSYARQFLERMEKPDVESVSGICPSIAIAAKNVITNARSTVGTQTEINDYLRLLFARIGVTYCPDCKKQIAKATPSDISNYLVKHFTDQPAVIGFKLTLEKGGKKYLKEFLPELEKQGFYQFWMGGKKLDTEGILKKKKIEDYLFVSVDDLRIAAKSKKRLFDSLETAKRYGKGEIWVKMNGKEFNFKEGFSCFQCGRNFKEPSPNLFSFNSPLGACETCQGFGRVITLDWDLIVPDKNKSLYEGAIEPWTKPSSQWEFQQMLKFCRRKKIPTHKPWKNLKEEHRKWILKGVQGGKYQSVQDFFDYLQTKSYKMHVRIFMSKYRGFAPCETCGETRLKPEALFVKVHEKTIFDLLMMDILKLNTFLESISLSQEELGRVEPVLIELKKRVRFLKEVGLGYLTLARLSRTLSGGEVQRIHLATSLGSALVDTLYVLDEPSIGLHERDNELLIRLLKELRDLGNTIVVVEHDRAMIETADEVLDLGPTGGENGGQLIYQGKVEALKKVPDSLTGRYLSGDLEIKRKAQTLNVGSKNFIEVKKAQANNLKGIDVKFPLGQMVVLTGVSGSGKSTLLYQILYRHYLRFRGRPVQDLGDVKSISGFEHIDDLVLVDQTPIGRTPRSNPVTYIKAFDDIRKLFASTYDAKRLGYHAGSFSFNVDGGRCDMCKGDGRVKIEMHFLADVYVECEACRATRYKSEVLEVRYQGKNIHEVLEMTVREALEFFSKTQKIVEKLHLLKQVGLDYLRLGQAATTLSGGEAQRLKLAVEMMNRKAKHILYFFDEPTTGLHYHDIHYLLEAFDELLLRGHSIVIIEHNMEIIKTADYIIDLGPEGGDMGGQVIFQGPADELKTCKESHTGQFLKQYLLKHSMQTT